MPITEFLDAYDPDPEAKRVMGIAFEMALIALRLENSGDPVVAMIAQKIIELAKAGEHNPDLLCDRVLYEFGKQRILDLVNRP